MRMLTGIVKIRSSAVLGMILWAAAAFVGVSPTGIAEAGPRPLFEEPHAQAVASQVQRQARGSKRSTDVRGRRVKIDVSSISGAGLPDGAESIGLNLFPDADMTAVKQRFERRGAGRSTWIGKVSDDPESSVILAEVDGLVAGSVFAHGKHYSIRGKDAESQEVVEIDQSAFAPEACDQPPAGDQVQFPSAPSAPPEAQADTGSAIDVTCPPATSSGMSSKKKEGGTSSTLANW